MAQSEVPQLSKIPIGSSVSLITSVQYRYEGTVAAINSIEDTITLQNVRFWGAENRASGNASSQMGDNKGPAIGSLFDSVTFWMSNVIKLQNLDETVEKNELSDNAVKATSTTEAVKPIVKKSNLTQNNTTESATSSRNSYRASRNGRPPNIVQQPAPQMQRQTVSYPRRGRNSGSGRRSFMPFASIQTQSGVPGRNGYVTPVQNVPYKLINGGRQGYSNRRSGPLGGAGKRNAFPLNSGSGGMFVYLPPEMAAAYQPRTLTMMPQQMYNSSSGSSRRRNNERRNVSLRGGPVAAVPEVDCSAPYDFDSANAELEAELAKINLNAESSDEQDNLSSGDGQLNATSADQGAYSGSASGSGASGDSLTGAVTSTIVATEASATNATEVGQKLAKGEFYVREKCFFDQISRSEGGPRGPVGGGRGTFKSERSRFSGTDNIRTQVSGSGVRSGHGGSISAARRERQLNIETFGQIATRSIYNQRRRPTGSVPRDLLVSATA